MEFHVRLDAATEKKLDAIIDLQRQILVAILASQTPVPGPAVSGKLIAGPITDQPKGA